MCCFVRLLRHVVRGSIENVKQMSCRVVLTIEALGIFSLFDELMLNEPSRLKILLTGQCFINASDDIFIFFVDDVLDDVLGLMLQILSLAPLHIHN